MKMVHNICNHLSPQRHHSTSLHPHPHQMLYQSPLLCAPIFPFRYPIVGHAMPVVAQSKRIRVCHRNKRNRCISTRWESLLPRVVQRALFRAGWSVDRFSEFVLRCKEQHKCNHRTPKHRLSTSVPLYIPRR